MPPTSGLKNSREADWLAWFDGSAKPNPGNCKIACVLHSPDGKVTQHAASIGYGDSSDAEYQALIAALTMLTQQVMQPETQTILLRGDSQVVINDVLAGELQASRLLSAYRQQAQTLMSALPGLRLKWVPRHKNTETDQLLRV
ncbi:MULTISPECIES: ribonuclease HI family protein [unclassified Undibacterium]|uniref:ribonuclease HI family protein n=1 Tax=unclassified Undibacterium TaxID=2630295 RepID=UPI003C2FCF96